MISEIEKKLLLEHLREVPAIIHACKAVGVSRASFYRLLKEDKEFKKEVDDAMLEGENAITDYIEAQLISLAVQDRKIGAMKFWLINHSKKYIARRRASYETLNPEPEKKKNSPEVEKAIDRAIATIKMHMQPQPEPLAYEEPNKKAKLPNDVIVTVKKQTVEKKDEFNYFKLPGGTIISKKPLP